MKYLHILLHNETKFNKKLFEMLNSKELGFDSSEQFFLTPYKNVYDSLSAYEGNITFSSENKVKMINHFGKKADWIFIHALNLKKYEVIQIKKSIAKKIIWREWGHDILEKPDGKNSLKNVARHMLDKSYVKKINQFYAIGTGFRYDDILIKKRYGNMKTFLLNYSYQKGLEELYKKALEKKSNHGLLRVMVAHSGSPIMHHIEILEALRHLSEEPIQIVLILSYGDAEYISKVKSYAVQHFKKEQLDIIENFLSMEEYLALLNSVDIAAFDQVGSAALGNLTPLLYFNKKFVFNKNGLLKQIFDMESLPYLTTDQLQNISFEKLAEKFPEQEKERKLTEERIKEGFVPNTWKKAFAELSEENN